MTTSADPRRVLIFGAGSTGRGHIGQLAAASGFHLVLVDRDEGLIKTLRRSGRYTVRLYGAGTREVIIDDFVAYTLGDVDSVTDEIAQPDTRLILTAVLAENLSQLAPLLSQGIARRAERGVNEPLNVVACENMINASSALLGYVLDCLEPRHHPYLRACVGFPNAMVARVVPAALGDKLLLEAEDYNEWTVDRTAFLGDAPLPEGMELVDNLSARLERKLFMHNTGHAICGYLGYLKGYQWMCDAVADPWIERMTRGAMTESGQALIQKHGFTPDSIAAYRDDFFPRVAARAIADPITRVIRSPRRKIGRNERLVGPACLALEYGIQPRHLAVGIAALLMVHDSTDPESDALHHLLETRGIAGTLQEAAGIDPIAHRLLIEMVQQAWEELKRVYTSN